MKNALLFVLHLLFPIIPFAQESKIDSFLHLIKIAKEDTNKVNLLLKLTEQLKIEYKDSETIVYAQQAYHLSKKLNYVKGEASANFRMGKTNKTLGRLALAHAYYIKSLDGFKKINDSNRIAHAYGMIGHLYQDQNDLVNAQYYLNLSLSIFNKISDKSGIYFFYLTLGKVFHQDKKYDTSLKYLYQALNVSTTLNKLVDISETYKEIGYVYDAQEQNQKAIEFYDQSLKFALASQSEFTIANIYNYYGNLNIKLKNYREAKKQIDISAKLFEKVMFKSGIRRSHYSYSNLYNKLGDYEKAFKHYKIFIKLRDSVMNIENASKIANQQFLFNQKEKEALLQYKAELEKQKQVLYRNIYLVGIIIISLLTTLFIKQYRKIKQTKQQLEIVHLKQRISRDLHDEIGSTLSSVSMQASVAKRKLTRQEDIKNIIENISSSSQEMVSKMSDIVWSLQSENENTTQLIERISNYCAVTLPENNINFTVDSERVHSNANMHTEILRELYLIIKEAINNSLKHAKCKDINVVFIQEEGKFSIQVSDNGAGFDMSKPSRSMSGFGLKNMKQRAEKLNAKFSILSEIEKGTRIDIEIPLV